MQYFFFILFITLFSACSTKEFQHNDSKIIIIKSPKIKFSDLGFIRHSGNEMEIELFIAGKAVQNISINHLICVDNGCMSKSGFNKEYLNANYPDTLLQNVFLAKPIFHQKNKQLTQDGFTQKIQSITYKVTKKSVFFKDTKNHIIIKIKDTQ